MAYMNPQQWRDALIGIGQGKRLTAYEDPNEADPRDVLKFTGSALDRWGAPNLAASRAASGTYDPSPVQQASTGTGLTPLQKGVEQLNQQRRGSVAGRSRIPSVSEQPSLYPSDIGQAAPGYGYGPSVPQGSDDPQGMMNKVGGFFDRPGAARDLGAALTSLGAGLGAESSRPGGSAWAGLASGANLATQSLARSREQALLEAERAREEARIVADREFEAAERDRQTKAREGMTNAIALMVTEGSLTDDQANIARDVALTDPAAAQSLIAQYTRETQTGTLVGTFIESLSPDDLEAMETSGRIDWLRADNSVVPPDQKLDIIMTHRMEGERRENAIDSLLWKLHNIDDRSLATPEQLEQARYIARNAEYTETMLRSPLNWVVIDLGDKVEYWRGDTLIKSFDKAVDDPVVSPTVMAGFEEFYNDQRDAGRRELYTWKRGLEAVDQLPDEAFGERARGLRRAWKTFQNYASSDLTRAEALAVLEASWAQLGFANLSAFVGPTSD